MYVEKTEKYFELREKDIERISKYKNSLSIELFEELLLETVNKNKTLNYFLSTLKNTVSNNIKTLEEYEIHKKNYIAKRKNGRAIDSSSKKSSTIAKNNKFANFQQTYEKYSDDELDEIIAKIQR